VHLRFKALDLKASRMMTSRRQHLRSKHDEMLQGVSVLFLCLGLFFFGDEVLEDLFPEKRPNPKTIEERVSRILSDTPLIGI
jgi:hypothetical protein